jgi:hypothetical protein
VAGAVLASVFVGKKRTDTDYWVRKIELTPIVFSTAMSKQHTGESVSLGESRVHRG